jgi:hypothetical protein
MFAFGAPGAALAKPDKPENAAKTAEGTGCMVRDGAGAYHFDAKCTWHTVVKTDKDGTVVLFRYQDKGQLPEGAPRPTQPAKALTVYPGCPDGADELTTPSGAYSSDCKFGK